MSSSVRGGVAALRLLERGDAVADRLDTGQRGAAGGERAQQQEEHGEPGQAGAGLLRHEVVLGALGLGQGAGGGTDEAEGGHADDAQHERVDRDGERLAGLAHPPQVHRGQQHDEAHRDRHLVPTDQGQRRAGVLHARGDRHRDGQHVVDQQRAGHGQPGPGAEVDGGDLVVAAARGVGVHVLPVRRDDDEHDEDDTEPDRHEWVVAKAPPARPGSGRSRPGRRPRTTGRRWRRSGGRAAWAAGSPPACRCAWHGRGEPA